MKTIDLVVPCYNEEEGLEHFVTETNKVIASMPDYSFRYILVNDGSRDKTYLIMKKLAKKFDNIQGSRNVRRLAAHNRRLCGGYGRRFAAPARNFPSDDRST